MFQKYDDLSGDQDLNPDESNPPPAKKEKVDNDHKVNLCPIINPIQKVILKKSLTLVLLLLNDFILI